MRKITNTLVLLAAAAMAFASCSKEKETPVPTPEEGTIRVKFAANAALTKVGLTPNDGDTQFSATWDNNDQIAITSFVSGGAMKETVDAFWASDDECFYTDFEAESYPEGSYDFIGVWPVGKAVDELFPAVRHQSGAEYKGDYDIMRSNRVSDATLSSDQTIVLDMVRQTSIAYFHITSELNENIVSATLTTDKPIASSNATLDYNGFKPNAETAGVTSIKLIIDGEMSSSDFKLWFNVLPVQYETMSLLIETANHSFSLSKKSSGEWKAGELNKVVLTNVPAEKWAEIERPAGETTETITMVSDNTSEYKSESNNITATFAKAGAGNAPAWNASESAVRVYAKGTLTVSSEYTITKIVYEAKLNGGGKNNDNYPTPTTDKESFDSNTWTWEGAANSVVLTPDGTAGNIAVSSITVSYVDPNAGTDPIYKYSVMVDKNVTNGTIGIDKTSAKAGDIVTLTPQPADGYELVANSLKAINAVSGAELTVTDNKFTMPAANVNVTAAFSLIPTLSATSPEPYASNLTNNSGNGFSIPVIANQAWVAAIKTDDPNAADITLITSEGEGGENNNLVFKFNSQNTSPLVAKSTVVIISPKNGNRPEPVEITITHEKRGATLVLNDDDKANITANVLATETSYTVNITNANFSEWSVLEYKIGDAAQSTSDANCVTTHDDGANTGSVTIGFPANASESNDVTITLKVGYEGIITKTLILTQAAAAARTPNVILDFTDNTSWEFPTSKTVDANTYSDGTTTITLEGTSGNGYSFNETDKYLLLGKSGATLTFQSFDFDVDKIKVYGRTDASASVKQNIYVGDVAVSTETTSAKVTNTYEIAPQYQAAGNVFVLKVTNAYNTQITKIEIFGGTPKTVTSVVVSGTPDKKSYEAGEVFNPAGLSVTANYDDGSSKVVTTGITWTDGDGNELTGLTAGTTSVTVKAIYKDIPSAAFPVNGLTVTAPKVLDHITVKTSPKVTYDADDKFDPTNLVITKHYTDSSTEDVEYNSTTASAFTFNPLTSTPLTTSNTSVRITYGGKSCDLPITVNPKKEKKTLTFNYSNKDSWTVSVKAWQSTSYVQMFKGHYVESASVTVSSIESITVNMRLYGGPTTDADKSVKVSFAGVDIQTLAGSSTTLANKSVTATNLAGKSGTGKFKVASTSTSTSKGVGVASVTIVYYE